MFFGIVYNILHPKFTRLNSLSPMYAVFFIYFDFENLSVVLFIAFASGRMKLENSDDLKIPVDSDFHALSEYISLF